MYGRCSSRLVTYLPERVNAEGLRVLPGRLLAAHVCRLQGVLRPGCTLPARAPVRLPNLPDGGIFSHHGVLWPARHVRGAGISTQPGGGALALQLTSHAPHTLVQAVVKAAERRGTPAHLRVCVLVVIRTTGGRLWQLPGVGQAQVRVGPPTGHV